MEGWRIVFLESAERDLSALDRSLRRKIITKLEWLLRNFSSLTPVTLSGEFRTFYKVRAGDWRILYRIDWTHSTLIISHIDRRDHVYKKKRT